MGVGMFVSPPMPDVVKVFVALDLGQRNDSFALGVLERRVWYGEQSLVDYAKAEHVNFDVRHLQRFPLGTPYPVMVDCVGTVLEALLVKYSGRFIDVVFDSTGVGVSVGDYLRGLKVLQQQRAAVRGFIRLTPVTLHGGEAERDGKAHGGVSLPKADAIAAAVVLIERGLLRVAARIPEREVLIREMVNFRSFLSQQGHRSFANDGKVAKHDDLVTVISLLCWAAQRDRRKGGYLNGSLALPCQYG